MRLPTVDQAALDLTLDRIDPDEAIREVRAYFPNNTPREIEWKLRLTGAALIKAGER